MTFPEWVHLRTPTEGLQRRAPWARLDPGESAAIALAAELDADLVLVDEERGRSIARQLGLRTAGVLAVLLDAKAEGKISAVKPLLDCLQHDAQFYLAASIRAHVLELAGEPS